MQLVAGRPSQRLACEASLRVAAATLSHAPPHEVTGATVVAVLEGNDPASFRGLVAAIADESRLRATARLRFGSFSVRFVR